MKKKTHEEYVIELAVKNPTVEVVGEYVNAQTPIMHHCLIHDVYWEVLPGNALKGKGCKECMKDKNRNKFTKTHEEYIKELAKKNPTVEVIDKYIDSKTSIRHHCLIHDVYWDIMPSNALKGQGCEQCKLDKLHQAKRKSHDDYVFELSIKNPNIEVVEEYNGANNPILHKCLKHNEFWNISPSDALLGHGCPSCHKEKVRYALVKTHEDYVCELSIKNPNIEVTEKYIDGKTAIMHHCLIHDVYWKTLPSNILKGCGCPQCRSEKISDKHSKAHDEYVYEVHKTNPDIIVLETYVNAKTPILHKCIVHNFEWKTTPNSILQGCGCPLCNESFGERKVRQCLEKYKIAYKFQKTFNDCKNKNPLPFDFYLPDYHICIEYQGRQHYEPIDYFGGDEAFKVQQKHDEIKKEYCEQNNIYLLYIPYWENDIENIILDYLKLYDK